MSADRIEPPPAAMQTLPDHDPPPIQFRVKTLLAVTAACSVAFAAMGRLSAVWAVALAWFLLLVAGHVAANAMGTQSAERATARLRRRPDDDAPLPDPFRVQQALAPTTRLGSRNRLGLGTALFVGLGAAVGCLVGTALIIAHSRGVLGWPALALAAGSSAGIGAFLSFLAATCAKVASKAFRESSATADPRR